jgi:hypothetical protein
VTYPRSRGRLAHKPIERGSRFTRLVVEAGPISKRLKCGRIRHFYNVRCDCGSMSVVAGFALRSGSTKSCGCYVMDLFQAGNRARQLPAAERLESASVPEPNTGCWLWTAFRTEDGYGKLSFEGQMWTASRLSYVTHVGPIPDGLCVCHHCDTPACINPAHLFLGTHRDNSDDKWRKGRAAVMRGEDHHAAVLTETQVAELRRMDRSSALAMAPDLGVSEDTIVSAVMGWTWRHVDVPARPVRKQRRISDELVAQIRSSWDGKPGCQTRIARTLGVSEAYVSMVVRGLLRNKAKPTAQYVQLEPGSVIP